MKKAIETIIDSVKKQIIGDLKNDATKVNTTTRLIHAYNDFQDSERDGVDHLFNIFEKEDLICCLRGGLTTDEIAKLYNDYTNGEATRYFFFGANHYNAKAYKTMDELCQHLIAWLDDVILNVMTYPYAYDSYKELYINYITNKIIGE